MKRLRHERAKQEKIFTEELEKLQTLLDEKLIDQHTYVRLRKLLERGLTRRAKRFDAESARVELLGYHATKCPYCKQRIFVPELEIRKKRNG